MKMLWNICSLVFIASSLGVTLRAQEQVDVGVSVPELQQSQHEAAQVQIESHTNNNENIETLETAKNSEIQDEKKESPETVGEREEPQEEAIQIPVLFDSEGVLGKLDEFLGNQTMQNTYRCGDRSSYLAYEGGKPNRRIKMTIVKCGEKSAVSELETTALEDLEKKDKEKKQSKEPIIKRQTLTAEGELNIVRGAVNRLFTAAEDALASGSPLPITTISGGSVRTIKIAGKNMKVMDVEVETAYDASYVSQDSYYTFIPVPETRRQVFTIAQNVPGVAQVVEYLVRDAYSGEVLFRQKLEGFSRK